VINSSKLDIKKNEEGSSLQKKNLGKKKPNEKTKLPPIEDQKD